MVLVLTKPPFRLLLSFLSGFAQAPRSNVFHWLCSWTHPLLYCQILAPQKSASNGTCLPGTHSSRKAMRLSSQQLFLNLLCEINCIPEMQEKCIQQSHGLKSPQLPFDPCLFKYYNLNDCFAIVPLSQNLSNQIMFIKYLSFLLEFRSIHLSPLENY